MGFRLSTFNSRLARRWFGWLTLGTLLPIVIGGLWLYQTTSQSLEQRAMADLRGQAKYLGLSALENVRRIEARMRALMISPGERGPSLPGLPVNGAIWSSSIENLDGATERAATVVLRSGRSQLHTLPMPDTADASAKVTLIVPNEDRVLFADLDMYRIAVDPLLLPTGTKLCIHTQHYRLGCIADPDSDQLALDGELVESSWTLFLTSTYDHADWRFTLSRSESDTFAAVNDMRRMLLPGSILVICLTLFAGLRMVRYTLAPIETLADVSQRFANGERAVRANIDTDDELADLGFAFNAMTQRISEQFSLMEALAEIDQLLIGSVEVGAVCDRVLTTLKQVLPDYSHGIVLRDGDGIAWLCHSGNTVNASAAAISFSELVAELDPRERYPLHGHGQMLDALGLPSSSGWLTTVDGSNDTDALILSFGSKNALSEEGTDALNALCYRLSVALSSIETRDALYRRLNYDDVTGLANRDQLTDRLTALFVDTGTSRDGVLFVLNLDRFQSVNELFGFHGGNRLLYQVGERLQQCVNDNSVVSRIGADEFGVLVTGSFTLAKARQFAVTYLQALAMPFRIHDKEHVVSASIGISIVNESSSDAEYVLRRALAAVRDAKSIGGRQRIKFSDSAQNEEILLQAQLEQALRHALTRDDQLSVSYQAKIDCDSSRVAGAEALLRWQHPQLGQVSPADFIPIAESCGLIRELGLWVFRQAAHDFLMLPGWLRQTPGFRVAVNVSPLQLEDHEFTTDLLAILADAQISPAMFEIEITETATTRDADRVNTYLSELRASGFQVAIDDFGTGYSSLAKLIDMPFDTLKIDQAFIRQCTEDTRGRRVTSSLIALAKQLDKFVVAEGVETQEQFAYLQSLDCNYSQGFLHAKALPLELFIELVSEERHLDSPVLASVS